MNIDLKETIEKRFVEYLDKVKEWSDDIPTGKIGECNLCGKKDNLTEHHLIPKRAFKNRSSIQLQNFLDRLTVDICNTCHNYIHPENIWKRDLIEFQNIFEEKAKELEKNTSIEIEKIQKEIGKTKQDYNNIVIKLSNRETAIKDKADTIAKLKEEISILKKNLNEKQDEVNQLQAMHREDDAEIKRAEDDAHIIYNILNFYQNDERFRKDLKAELRKKIENEKAILLKRESPSSRDIKLMTDKLQRMPIFFEAYDRKKIEEMQNILGKIFAEEFDEAMREAFSTEDFQLKKVNKDGSK